ncbi:MAG: BMC domain-containing protein [Planctomycetales bacterium]|nr:BMC domain-containing protein [Planctomycetales bacterium]
MNEALGILETQGFTPAIVALDAMEKAANIRVYQAELNDFLGYVVKVVGSVSDVTTAVAQGHRVAETMRGRPVSSVINRPDGQAWLGIQSKSEFNPLIQQNIVFEPQPMADASNSFALGFIETQGFTAVFEAVDTACKTAGVEVVGKEKLGGGYITIVVKGDVAAVTAAIEAGKAKVEGLGKLIAGHVIARPSAAALSLLPKA